MKDIQRIEGKEFASALDGKVYAIHEAWNYPLPEYYSVEKFGLPIANDPCGNLFTENSQGEICYWDHETDEVSVIDKNWHEFEAGCSVPNPDAIELKPDRVISAWMDPEFAKEMGIEVPEDGWIKRSTWLQR